MQCTSLEVLMKKEKKGRKVDQNVRVKNREKEIEMIEHLHALALIEKKETKKLNRRKP